jgi:hypothetical protein
VGVVVVGGGGLVGVVGLVEGLEEAGPRRNREGFHI